MTLKENFSAIWYTLKAISSYWYRAPVQLCAVIFGLALATSLWSAVQAINSEARASYARANAQLSMNSFDTITHSSRSLGLSDYVTLRRAGWNVSPVAQFPLPNHANISVVLIDVLSHPTRQEGATPSTEQSASGPLIWSNAATLKQVDEILSPDGVNIDSTLPDDIIVADFSQAPVLEVSTAPLHHLLLHDEQLPDLADLTTLVPGLRTNESTLSTDPGTLTESFHLNLTAFGLLSFVVGLFIVHSMINLSLEQRRGLFRTLRCLGVPISTLIIVLGFEMLFLALIAGSGGIALGYVFASALMPGVSGTLEGLYGADIEGVLQLRPGWVLSGLTIAFIGSVLAGAKGLYLVARLPILQSPAIYARGQHVQNIRTHGAKIGGVLISIGVIVLLSTDTLLGGFFFLGAIMLGTALTLPLVLSKVINILQSKAHQGIPAWLWSDLGAQMPSLSLPLMALLLAVATNIGVETMTSSFRLTLISWLEQRFTADLYLRLDEEHDSAAIQSWLKNEGSDALPLMTAKTTIEGRMVALYGLPEHRFYSENWPVVASQANPWPAFHRGQGIMINEQMAYGMDLSLGNQLSVGGTEQEVLGIYPDYGNTEYQMVMAQKTLMSFPWDIRIPSLTVLLEDGSKQLITLGLKERFGISNEYILDQSRLRSQSLAVFDQTFLITNALNILTLTVAAFALLTSFLSMWSQRLPQIAPIWAMGVPVHRLAKYEILRSLGLGTLVAILAVPLGLVLAWTLLSVINVQAFGWKLPFHASPGAWLKVICLAMLAATFAALIPAQRLRTIAPSTLLKVFNNER